jgi:hypothetical protein
MTFASGSEDIQSLESKRQQVANLFAKQVFKETLFVLPRNFAAHQHTLFMPRHAVNLSSEKFSELRSKLAGGPASTILNIWSFVNDNSVGGQGKSERHCKTCSVSKAETGVTGSRPDQQAVAFGEDYSLGLHWSYFPSLEYVHWQRRRTLDHLVILVGIGGLLWMAVYGKVAAGRDWSSISLRSTAEIQC